MNPGIFGPGFSTQKDDNRPPIGSMEVFPDMSPTITLSNREVWLRTGVVASAATYPLLSRVEHARAHVCSTATGTLASTGATRIVCSPSGIYVATHPGMSQIRRSINNGLTWTNHSLNLMSGNSCFGDEGVVFANGLFVAVLASSDVPGTIEIHSSSDGAGWTRRFADVSVPDCILAGAAVCWTGTFFLASFCSSSNAKSVVTSTDGISWTPRTITGINTGALAAGQSVCGTNGVGLVSSFGGNYAIVSNLGATASMSANLPISSTKIFAAVGTNFILMQGNIANMWVTDSPASGWTRVSNPIPKAGAGLIPKSSGNSEQPLFAVLTGRQYFAFTEDGITWKMHYKVQLGNTAPGGSTPFAVCQGPTEIVFSEDGAAGQTVHIATNSTLKLPNSCGVPTYSQVPLFSGNSILGHNDLAYYIRAK